MNAVSANMIMAQRIVPMSTHSIAQVTSISGASLLAELPAAFLVPAACSVRPSTLQSSRFSTCPVLAKDRSRLRGVSAIHRTGPRQPLEASRYPLPVPAPQKPRELNESHGLWGFFNKDRKAISTPQEDYAHGRAWSIQELRQKSWEDLYHLWWICVLERNRMATARCERQRLAAGYGDYEANDREKTVRATQHAIKHVLRERWYAWEDARELYNDGYRPDGYETSRKAFKKRMRNSLRRQKNVPKADKEKEEEGIKTQEMVESGEPADIPKNTT